MTQLGLLSPPRPPSVDGIDLRCCDVAEVLAEVRGARLIHADPPWHYEREAGTANPNTHSIYSVLSDAEIVEQIDQSWVCAGNSARLLCWYTWPKEEDWRDAGQAGPRWGRRKSAGSWTKWPRKNGGVGYHWRGMTEPAALFTKGATGRPTESFYNGHTSPQGVHSEKPIMWLREMVRAWTDPGDLVLDLYAGLAPMARACALEGRRYIGAEIDPERHRAALDRLALRCGRRGGAVG